MKRVLSFFATPTAYELAVRELAEAKRDLLRAQSAAEYATKMCEYHRNRINRLEAVCQAQ